VDVGAYVEEEADVDVEADTDGYAHGANNDSVDSNSSEGFRKRWMVVCCAPIRLAPVSSDSRVAIAQHDFDIALQGRAIARQSIGQSLTAFFVAFVKPDEFAFDAHASNSSRAG
jgi:hypothetical protein